MQPRGSRSGADAPQHSPRRRILLIEDNSADATLTKIVHDEVKQCSWLDIVTDGRQALKYLRGEAEYSGNEKPDVILMDVALPIKSGLELISEIRAVPGCEVMPIVIVSGSDNPVTVQQAYELGANCVIKKPSTLDEYFHKLGTCYEFWCGVAEVPAKPE